MGGLLLFFGVPVTMAILAMKVGDGYVVASLVVTMTVCWMLISLNALAGLPFLILGLLVGRLLKRGEALYETAGIASASALCSLFLLYVFSDMMGMMSPDALMQMIETSFTETVHAAASQNAAVDPTFIAATSVLLIQLLPAGIVFLHFILALICATLVCKLAKRLGVSCKAEPFTKLILSPQAKSLTIWITTVFFVLFFIGVRNLFLLNATVIIFYVNGVVGIAGIIGLILSSHRKKAAILVGFVVAHMVIGPLSLYFYAILDAHYDFRGVKAKL